MYDLLGREVELREKRQTVLARTLEIQEVVLLRNLVLLMKMPTVMMMLVMPMAKGYGVVDGDNDNKMQVEAGLRNSAQHVTEETSKVPIARCHKYERYICAIPQI